MNGPGWTVVGDMTVIAPAWQAALGEMSDVAKTSAVNAGAIKYRYADLGAVIAVVRAVLARHDLGVFQVPTIVGDRIEIVTTLLHNSGTYVVFAPLSLPVGKTAQDAGGAATYARRYALLAQLGLATEDDDGAGAGASAPQEAPMLLSLSALTRFRTETDFLTEAERGDAVWEATKGRTRDIEEVRDSEGKALMAAVAWRRDSPTGVSQSAKPQVRGQNDE